MGEQVASSPSHEQQATIRRVAGSLYRIAANANARVWERGRDFVPLGDGWQRLLGAE